MLKVVYTAIFVSGQRGLVAVYIRYLNIVPLNYTEILFIVYQCVDVKNVEESMKYKLMSAKNSTHYFDECDI